MARSRETKIELTAYDDLFQTDESREEAKLSKIRDIPISEIDEFPDHPFKVLMDEDMEQLVESIKRNGVMTPATVRLKEDGRYELISGHRRKKACELAGLETLKCEVKELTRDEAIIVMVESNLQRSVILPSEKAFAYKMRLEAMKRQAGRPPKENASPLATNLSKGRSDEELGELVGESKDQICVVTLPQRAMAFTPLGLIPDPNGNLTNLRQTLIRSSMLYGRIKGFCITAMI